MDEGASEKGTRGIKLPVEERAKSVKEAPKQKSRRNFLKVLGAGALGGLSGLALNKLGLNKENIEGALGVNKNGKPAPAGQDIQLEKVEPKLAVSEFDLVFGELPEKEKGVARSTVDEMKYEVLKPHPDFEDLMAVTNTFQKEIHDASEEFDLPSDLVSGMVFIENGGGVARLSRAGALGPAQLMVDAAREVGLRVDEEVDERTDTTKCFKAMTEYLAKQRDFFSGNLGFGIWAYHAGPGNVAWAIQEYLIDTKGIDIGSLKDAYDVQDSVAIQKVTDEILKWTSDPDLKLNVHQVLSNPGVIEKVIPKLEDETELYVYKAVGGTEVFLEHNGVSSAPVQNIQQH